MVGSQGIEPCLPRYERGALAAVLNAHIVLLNIPEALVRQYRPKTISRLQVSPLCSGWIPSPKANVLNVL